VSISSTSTSTSSTNFPSNSSGTSEKIIDVLANSQGVDTGVDLRQEDNVTITATGNIFSRGTGSISPDGNNRYGASAGSYPVPDAAFGALVGYIRMNNGRSSRPFMIGSQRTFSAPADGRLILMMNDDDYRDNSGSFRVRIVY
jgi:hypothetical protein